MEGFTYNNIFDTKGIEYIAVLIFFAFLVPFWIILNHRRKVSRVRVYPKGSLSLQSIRVPKGMFFSSNHTWSFLEKSGNAKVGLSDLLLHFTGQVLIRQTCEAGASVKKGDVIAEVEQEGRKLQIFSPLTGTLVENNHDLQYDPGIIYSDPYGEGWICRIEPVNWREDTAASMLAGKANEWTRMELARFKDFIATRMSKDSPGAELVLQDGGEIANHALSSAPGEVWESFQKEFLK